MEGMSAQEGGRTATERYLGWRGPGKENGWRIRVGKVLHSQPSSRPEQIASVVGRKGSPQNGSADDTFRRIPRKEKTGRTERGAAKIQQRKADGGPGNGPSCRWVTALWEGRPPTQGLEMEELILRRIRHT